MNFFVVQNIRDAYLLESFVQVFGCGSFSIVEKSGIARFAVLNFSLSPPSPPRGAGWIVRILYLILELLIHGQAIPLNNNYEFRSEIVLEQYYLLGPSFNLNKVNLLNGYQVINI